MFPPSANGSAGGCDRGPCPFTDRLRLWLAHLKSQTPTPDHRGDICNFDLLTGSQAGIETPVADTILIGAKYASVTVSNHGQTTPVVALTVINVSGRLLVDDLRYELFQPARSVYSLSCTGSLGGG